MQVLSERKSELSILDMVSVLRRGSLCPYWEQGGEEGEIGGEEEVVAVGEGIKTRLCFAP
jgi:hypothetical protein